MPRSRPAYVKSNLHPKQTQFLSGGLRHGRARTHCSTHLLRYRHERMPFLQHKRCFPAMESDILVWIDSKEDGIETSLGRDMRFSYRGCGFCHPEMCRTMRRSRRCYGRRPGDGRGECAKRTQFGRSGAGAGGPGEQTKPIRWVRDMGARAHATGDDPVAGAANVRNEPNSDDPRPEQEGLVNKQSQFGGLGHGRDAHATGPARWRAWRMCETNPIRTVWGQSGRAW